MCGKIKSVHSTIEGGGGQLDTWLSFRSTNTYEGKQSKRKVSAEKTGGKKTPSGVNVVTMFEGRKRKGKEGHTMGEQKPGGKIVIGEVL